MQRKTARVLICCALASSLLLPTAASAPKKLPARKYYCYYSIGSTFTYSTFDLKIKADGKYVFLQGNERVGGGRFTHGSDSDRIRFKTGYLHNKGFKGKHGFSEDGHTVRLTKERKSGDFVYSCAD